MNVELCEGKVGNFRAMKIDQVLADTLVLRMNGRNLTGQGKARLSRS